MRKNGGSRGVLPALMSPSSCYLLSLFLLPAIASAQQAEPPAGRPDNRMRFCGFGGDGELLDGLTPWWPNLDFCRAYDGAQVPAMADLAKAARARSMRFTLQAAAPVMPDGYLDKHQAWSIDFLNRKPAELGFGHPVADYCHPATVAAIKGNLDTTFKDVGASAFAMVDFVWPWVGGQWGYSESCFAAYRGALDGSDGGLRVNGPGKPRVMTFWDYFAELSGLRFTPAELGLKSWREYEPLRPNLVGADPSDEQRRNAFLFRGLFHWCWLKYAQEAGAHAKSLGGELQASLNPENSANGTDLLMWGRLTDTGEPWLEQWGSPWTAIAGYHTYRYFTEPYRGLKGKRLGLIGETGAAGGHPDSGFGPARPHYWDPASNYALTWAIGAAGKFDDREEDYIWASPQETLDPAGPQADCWRGYVKAMDGFWQYALDAPVRPVAPILSVVNRSILHSTDSSEQSVHQKFSLAPALVDLHLDFEQAYFPVSDTMLAGRKVLLFSPWDYPRDVLPRLQAWLKEDPSRLLVTHSFVPARPCKGLTDDAVPELDEADAAKLLGLQGLRQTAVSEGAIEGIAPEWSGIFPLAAGTRLKLERPLVACPGTPLVKLGGEPLVTRVGSVIYLNFSPPERYEDANSDTARLHRAVMEAIAKQAAITPLADGSASWACARYDLPEGHAFLLLDRTKVKAERFTEESPSMEPAAKFHLKLQPGVRYLIHDLLAETVGARQADDQGRLEIFLSGRSIRLLQVVPETKEPRLLFTTCERDDTRPRHEIPARLHSHRAGKAIITGIPAGAAVFVDGQLAAVMDTALPDSKSIALPKGDHKIEVRAR